MNLVLITPNELRTDGTARLEGRRASHIEGILRAAAGDRIRVGVLGGRMGEAQVLAIGAGEVVLRPALDRDPPPPAPVSLLLALPRPKILRRVLQSAASLGVKRIVLLGSWRVEKSYWGSPTLEPDAIREELILGLEQGRDTILPEVRAFRLFKPFVEDELDRAFPEDTRLLAHPGATAPLAERVPPGAGAALAVGPEGGFTPYEAGALRERGFMDFTLGDRILRVDAAVPYAIGQVDLWLRWVGRRTEGTPEG